MLKLCTQIPPLSSINHHTLFSGAKITVNPIFKANFKKPKRKIVSRDTLFNDVMKHTSVIQL